MAIVKFRPSLVNNVDSFFDDFFKSQFPSLSNTNLSDNRGTTPAVNVKETENDYQLEVAASGMDKKDFDVSVDNGTMTISAAKEQKDKHEEDGYTRKEFSYQSFHRSFTLPKGADDGKIQAKYNDGILHVTLPKKPEAKPQPAKKIKVL